MAADLEAWVKDCITDLWIVSATDLHSVVSALNERLLVLKMKKLFFLFKVENNLYCRMSLIALHKGNLFSVH